MTEKSKLLNGLENHERLAYQPPDLPADKLAKLNHAEWLEDFSKILALSTGVQMTAKRQGMITRLHWASLYVKALQHDLTMALALLEKTERELKERNEASTVNSAPPTP